MIRVAVIDDHAVVRMGLKYVLEMDGEFEFAGELANGNDAVKFVRETKPDVLLLDIYMPGKNGISVLEDVLIAFPDQKVIMLTTSSADNDAYTALELGAKGYLLKDRDAKDLPKAIRQVAAGGKFVPAEVRDIVDKRRMTPNPTLREQAVLEGLVAGKDNAQIADEMGISKNCVKIHVKHLFAKLGVEDRVSAVTSAIRPRTFVLALSDRRHRGGVPVELPGDATMPKAGDEITLSGRAEFHGDFVNVYADGYGKLNKGEPLFQTKVRNVDMRNGLLDYRTVSMEGVVASVSVDPEQDVEYTILGVVRGKMTIYVHVPGRLPESKYAGRRVKVEGCIFPVFDENRQSLAHIVEAASPRAVEILDTRWGMIAAWSAGCTLAAAFLAVFIAWARTRRRQLELAAVTAERKRMAADLHDTIEQHLACVKLLLCGALNNDKLPERTERALSRACEVLANAKMEVRDAVLNLRSDEAQTKTPAEAIAELARGIAKGGEIKVDVKLDGLPQQLRQGRHQDMLLIVREAIANAIKHGKAKTISIVCGKNEAKSAGRGGKCTLRVLNDGEKFDAEKALGPETGHYGLSGMRERAARSVFALRFVSSGGRCGIELDIS